MKKDIGLGAQNRRLNKLAIAMHSALICFGVATATLSAEVFAQPNTESNTQVRSYKIPAGSLKDALNRFSKQTGAKISLGKISIKGKKN